MHKLLNSGYQLLKRPTFIYHIGKKTYKLFSPSGANHRIAELQGNRHALKEDFWTDKVIEIEPKLFCFAMTRGEPISHINSGKADQFMEAKLKQALLFPRQAISSVVDFNRLWELKQKNMNMNLLEQAEEKLWSVYLPITSTHGDLHISNMIIINQEIKLIDWSMFNPKGTFITDFIHYHNHKVKVHYNESWTRTILKEQNYLHVLAEKINTAPTLLRLAYSIARISGEITQTRNISQVPNKQIEKYNYVLTRILNEL